MRAILSVALICGSAFAADPTVADLAWMSGCWTMTRGSSIVDEHWSKPAGGVMLGYTRYVRDGRITDHEYMRLEHSEGSVRYMARITPKDGGTPFTLKQATATEAVFENASHDFPQVIRYRLVSKDQMQARVENLAGTKGQDFPYKRVACD